MGRLRVFCTMDAMPEFDDEPGNRGDSEPQPLSFSMETDHWRRLFAECADGRRDALGMLYDVAAEPLYGFALWTTRSSDEAADLVAETFLRVAEQGRKLRDIRDPKAWLFTVVRRLAIDVSRQRRRRPTEPLPTAEMVTAANADPDRALDARRASVLLVRLPRRQREVVFLRHFGDCTFADIGRLLGIPTFTAASRYRLALRRLRKLMEEKP